MLEKIKASLIKELSGKKSVSLRTVHHKFDKKGKKVDLVLFDKQKNESDGTNKIIDLSGPIFDTLLHGNVLIIDELDAKLHPLITMSIVELFNSPESNPNNAQLIFATHEVTLLDRDLFRTDQIWFVEKNQFGETEFFSAQDFEGVREDVPFDKWYMAGKFGGLPKIEDIESIFINE